MKHKICLIDDSVPAKLCDSIDDTQRLTSKCVQHLLDGEYEWREEPIKRLLEQLLKKSDIWELSAYTHPAFYMNSLDSELYRPDIVIYDWEYAAGDDPKKMLIDIINTTYSVVHIFSGADHENVIRAALDDPKLKPYFGHRIQLLMKDVDESKLLDAAQEMYKKCFSFRFGKQLRSCILKSVEQVLIELGRHDINFVLRLLDEEQTREADIKTLILQKVRQEVLTNSEILSEFEKTHKIEAGKTAELAELLVTRISSLLESEPIPITDFRTELPQDEPRKALARQFWSFRLYYKTSDNSVRRGHIVCDQAEQLYLVLNADCDLTRFWQKNFGFINVVPLYDPKKHIEKLKQRLGTTIPENKIADALKDVSAKSLTTKYFNKISEGPFVLPVIPINGEMISLVGFPKEIQSLIVPPPALPPGKVVSERKNMPLTFENWTGFNPIACVAEPFLTPLVQHVFGALMGFGVPNYPRVIETTLREEFSGVIAQIWPAPIGATTAAPPAGLK